MINLSIIDFVLLDRYQIKDSLRKDPTQYFQKISSISGIGPTTINSLLQFTKKNIIDQDGNHLNRIRIETDQLFKLLGIEQSNQQQSNQENQISNENSNNSLLNPQTTALSGKNIVFSGKLSNMTRSEAQRIVEKLGGNVDQQITQQTNLVIIPTNTSTISSKHQKAIDRNIEIWTESYWDDFVKSNKSN